MKSLSNNPNVYTSGDLSHYFLPPSPPPDSISNHSQWPFSGHFSIPSPPPVQESTYAAAVSGGDDGAASSPVDVGCCVAVASNKTPADMLANSAVSPLPNQTPVAMDTSQLESQYDAEGKALASPKAPSNPSGRTVGIPPTPYRQLKTSGQGRQATSESSSKDSDEDDLGGDIEIPDNVDPAEARHVRRKLSNRESARRSRRKKQEQMTELQTQVDQLKVEKSTLLKQLNDINQKRDGAAIDNRIMKADIETLRAKVKMAEETVKRFTGMNLMPFVMNKAPKTGMPNAGVVDSTTATSYSQQTWNQYYWYSS